MAEISQGWTLALLQEVYKKPYTFQLTFPGNSAFIKFTLAKLGRTNCKDNSGAKNLAERLFAPVLPQNLASR